VLNGGGILRKEDATQPKGELISDEMSERIVKAAEQLATAEGAHTVTVRKILQALGITNRVFYNRFRNVDEVLEIVYRDMIVKVRRDIVSAYDEKQDFFEYVKDVVEKSLLISYDTKMRFNQFMFESDSISTSNYVWWTGEIKKLIDYAKAHDLIRDVDSEVMSYSIWCFCRGYNADAVGRQIPREEAVRNFRYSFGFLLDGLKK
jgi:AcrR family transcriptional regulator